MINDEIKRQVWAVEQEILDVIDCVCRDNNLRYSIFYGTLLGAVRHKGFIPWDDDIDIIMPRADYEKFIKIWNKQVTDDYILQTVDLARDYTNNFAKIRKNHTTYLQSEDEKKCDYHKGIFVDVFPADRLAPTLVTKTLQYCLAAVNLLYTREHPSGNGGIIGLTERVLLKFPKPWHKYLRDVAQRGMTHWNNCSTQYVSFNTIQDSKKYFPPNIFDKETKLLFEGKYYSAVTTPEEVLRCYYGDYMKLPPVEERVWFHHPICIDFEKNWGE